MRRTNISNADLWKIEEQAKIDRSRAKDFKKFSQSLDQQKIDEQNAIKKAMIKTYKQMQV